MAVSAGATGDRRSLVARRVRSPKPTTVVVIAVVVAVVAALALLRSCGDGDGDRRVAVSRDGRDVARLEIMDGVDVLNVTTDDLAGDLAVVSMPEQGRTRPRAELAHGRLRVWTEDDEKGTDAPAALAVTLATDVRWDVTIAEGARSMDLDLGPARVRRIDVAGGVQSLDLALPVPAGELVTSISGGAGNVALHAPDAVPARVTFGSGAGSVTLDGDHHPGAAPGTTLTTTDWTDTAAIRLVVDVPAGVGSLALDHRPG